MTTLLGIDIGGSGIKGAPVDVRTGELLAPRYRLATPQPATPNAVARVVAEVAKHFDWDGPIGATFPAVVRQGVVCTAVNVARAWVGVDAAELFTKRTAAPVTVINDADAAGIAEMEFGAGRGHLGTVLLVTLGTGIGSGLFVNGALAANTELGHLQVRGKDAERRASDQVREQQGLSWRQWAKRLNEYFATVEAVLAPELIIVGGGVSKKHEKFFPFLRAQAQIVPATLLNDAGIVGAAVAAHQAGH